MVREILIPRSFDPTYSWVGRRLRRRGDRLQAEARHYLYAVTVFAALVFVNFVTWAILQEDVLADPTGTTMSIFFAYQLGLFAAFIAGFGVGFRPEARITIASRTVRATQGNQQISFGISDVQSFERVDTRTFHRIHRRYEGVVEFAGRQSEVYLVLHLKSQSVALGITEQESAELESWMELEVDHEPTRATRLAH